MNLFWGCFQNWFTNHTKNSIHESKWDFRPQRCYSDGPSAWLKEKPFKLFLESKGWNKEKRFDTLADIQRINPGSWKVSRTFLAMTALNKPMRTTWRQVLLSVYKSFGLASSNIEPLNSVIIKKNFCKYNLMSVYIAHRLNQWQNDTGICFWADKLSD